MKVKGFLALLLFAALLLSGFGCGGGGAPGETPTPTAVGGSAGEIAEAAMAAAAELDTCQFDMDMDMTMTGETPATMTLDAEGAIDEPSEEMYMDMDMTMEMAGEEDMEMSMKMYVVEGWMYMWIDMGIPGMPAMWMKAPMTEGMWQEQNITSQQLDLLEDFVDVELLGSEMVSGADCYKLRVTPDLEKLWTWAQMQQGMEEVPDVGLALGEVITDLSLIQWVAKGTYFPMKMTLDMTMTIEGETIVMAMTMLMHHINEPVTIELPPEAADAVEVPMS